MTKLNVSNITLKPSDRLKGLKFPHIMTEELAYFCGIMAGDGSIYTRKSKNEYVLKCVGNPADEKPLYDEILAPLFQKLFNLQLQMKLHDSDTTYGFRLYSKALLNYFTEVIGLPCGKKYLELRIPAIIKQDKSFVISFLRGLADTDFSLSLKRGSKINPYYPVVAGSSKSKNFMEEVADEIENLGTKTKRYFDYVRMDSRIDRGFTVINRIEISGHEKFRKWMNVIGFSSPKHLKKVEKYRGKSSSGDRI